MGNVGLWDEKMFKSLLKEAPLVAIGVPPVGVVYSPNMNWPLAEEAVLPSTSFIATFAFGVMVSCPAPQREKVLES
jgi:hypothetical protein